MRSLSLPTLAFRSTRGQEAAACHVDGVGGGAEGVEAGRDLGVAADGLLGRCTQRVGGLGGECASRAAA